MTDVKHGGQVDGEARVRMLARQTTGEEVLEEREKSGMISSALN